jgi:thiamine transport system ATP-binding protein
MLFQDNNLFPHLTVAQNVALGIKPSLRINAEERQRIEKALADVGLEGYAERKPGALSGGQQSRAALARVLVQARPVILLDEPFAALGPALRAEMLGLVREVAARLGATLLMVTHDVGDARRLGGQAVFVEGGVAAAPVPVEDLLADPPPALSAYLGSRLP